MLPRTSKADAARWQSHQGAQNVNTRDFVSQGELRIVRIGQPQTNWSICKPNTGKQEYNNQVTAKHSQADCKQLLETSSNSVQFVKKYVGIFYCFHSYSQSQTGISVYNNVTISGDVSLLRSILSISPPGQAVFMYIRHPIIDYISFIFTKPQTHKHNLLQLTLYCDLCDYPFHPMFSLVSDSDIICLGALPDATLEIPLSQYKSFLDDTLEWSSIRVDVQPEPAALEAQPAKRAGRSSTNIWTRVEDDLLVRLIQMYGPQNWKQLAQIFNAETVGAQRKMPSIVQHWVRVLDPKKTNRKWTAQEDLKLVAAMRCCQPRAWKKISDLLEGRTDNQIVSRLKGLRKNFLVMQEFGAEYFP
ncbi:Myb-like DNA-binding domain-containing protein [Spironucleus salmonicida]|uniref:Myb-like DNA-binding domain-containing protein n=1 Tax=Spironucleus salmonicida TaxID=348837 RepID=A0A9P8LRG5_9EUKA|nr:Myb-like DNA-binding domain-containing protein [Spironucleus salmonicida]